MNALSALIKCASIGFLVGFLTSAGPNLGNDILLLAGLMVVISTVLVLFELTNSEPPATTVPARAA